VSINHRQLRQLHRIEAGLDRSAPQLAAMLAVFGRLATGQRMPAWEHMATRRDRIRQAAATIAEAVTALAAAVGLVLGSVLALLAAVVIGGRARPPLGSRRQVRPAPPADDRPDPAEWT
jgi:hypothetical protein